MFPVSLLAVLLILGTVYMVWYRTLPASSAQTGAVVTEPIDEQSVPPAPSSPKETYTLVEVSIHNSKNSCWTTINGGVYDVTSWIAMHPGGAPAIEALCGIDGSDAFNTQHGVRGKPASELEQFKMGALQK